MHVSGEPRANVTPNPYNSGHTAGTHRSTIERANVPLGLAVMTRLFTFLLGPRPHLGTEKGVLSIDTIQDETHQAERDRRGRLKPEFRL